MIVFGSDFDGRYPADGGIENVRIGDGRLDSFSYESIVDAGRHDTVEYDEIARVFAGNCRMTTRAWLFQDGDGYYIRHRNGNMVLDLATNALVRQQESTFVDEAYGLTFRIWTPSAGSHAYFDNGFLSVSNILWEFSPDGGTTWYPYYDIPNRAHTSAVLPKPTTSVRVRALSNDPTEWVQSFSITPITERRAQAPIELSGAVDSDVDFGMVTWEAVEGAEVYAVFSGNGELQGYTHANVYDAGVDTDTDGWYAIGMNVVSRTSVPLPPE